MSSFRSANTSRSGRTSMYVPDSCRERHFIDSEQRRSLCRSYLFSNKEIISLTSRDTDFYIDGQNEPWKDRCFSAELLHCRTASTNKIQGTSLMTSRTAQDHSVDK